MQVYEFPLISYIPRKIQINGKSIGMADNYTPLFIQISCNFMQKISKVVNFSLYFQPFPFKLLSLQSGIILFQMCFIKELINAAAILSL